MKLSIFYRSMSQGSTTHLDKWSTLRVFATYSQPPQGRYPFLLGEATFDLAPYIGKSNEVSLPLVVGGVAKGHLKCTISVLPQEEIPQADREILADNPPGRTASMSVVKSGLHPDELKSENSVRKAVDEEETKQPAKALTQED